MARLVLYPPLCLRHALACGHVGLLELKSVNSTSVRILDGSVDKTDEVSLLSLFTGPGNQLSGK